MTYILILKRFQTFFSNNYGHTDSVNRLGETLFVLNTVFLLKYVVTV